MKGHGKGGMGEAGGTDETHLEGLDGREGVRMKDNGCRAGWLREESS